MSGRKVVLGFLVAMLLLFAYVRWAGRATAGMHVDAQIVCQRAVTAQSGATAFDRVRTLATAPDRWRVVGVADARPFVCIAVKTGGTYTVDRVELAP